MFFASRRASVGGRAESCAAQAARRRAPVLIERLKEKVLGAVLRAVVLRAVVLRAVLFFALLRAVLFLALVVFLKEFFQEDLRAVVLRAGLLRAVVLRAVVLRDFVRLAGLLRAVVLRAVRRVRVGIGLLLIPVGITHEGRLVCRPRTAAFGTGRATRPTFERPTASPR